MIPEGNPCGNWVIPCSMAMEKDEFKGFVQGHDICIRMYVCMCVYIYMIMKNICIYIYIYSIVIVTVYK